jgi:TonB family protein
LFEFARELSVHAPEKRGHTMRMQSTLAALAALAAGHALADAPVQGPPHGAGPGCLRNYPEAAKIAGIEGTTTLAFTVTEQGAVADVRVAKSSGNADLDNAAAACAAQWRYKPARPDGKPAAVPWSATVQWKLP